MASFDVEHGAVDEGRACRVGQQARGLVARLAFAGIGLTVEVGCAPARGGGSARTPPACRGRCPRPGIERQVLLGHAAGCRSGRPPRDRRREGHRQPVLELGILAVDADAQCQRIQRLHAVEAIGLRSSQGEAPPRPARRAAAPGRADAAGRRSPSGRARTRPSVNRSATPRAAGQAADGIDVIVGGEIARAGQRKIRDGVLVRKSAADTGKYA